MDSSDSSPMATNGNAEQSPPIMKLSTEIREMIYRPLLVAKYAMTEHSMTTKEYNSNRRNIQDGPDQTYQFHTAVLRTNRRIHEEAKDLCRRENNFICLTSHQPSRLGYELTKRGLQMIAEGSKARGFWNISITFTLDPAFFGGWPQGGSRYCYTNGWMDVSEDAQPWSYIFSSDELPEFCRLLLEMSRDDDSILHDTVLYIDINPAIGNGEASEIDSYPAGLAWMRKHLSPLHQLHSFEAAYVQGPLSASYKREINSIVCKHCPTAMDIIHTAMASLEEADEQISRGQLLQANLLYKAALSFVRSCCWRYDERDFVMDSGPFPGLTAEQNTCNLVTERAIDPRRPYDGRQNKIYPLSIEPWEGAVYAEVLHVAAKISYTHGDVHEARNDLWDAGQLVPFGEEQEARYEVWQAQSDSLLDRRARQQEARELQSQKQKEKTEGMFLVACNWKSKGDRLLQRGRSDLAASKYKSTLSKIDLIDQKRDRYFELKSGTFAGYRVLCAINALRFKVQASVAATQLMPRLYKDVGRSTDAALTCSHAHADYKHDNSDNGSHSYWSEAHKWMEDQRLNYLRIYYCKALALNHIGDTVHAVENMERALAFDPEDGTVISQLLLLKQELEEGKA